MKTFLFLSLLILFTACKKEGNQGREVNYVSGRLLDAATLEPIEGGTISLWRKGVFYKDTLSAADGSYRMNFTPDEYFYKISAVANRYFSNKNIGSWPAYYEAGRPTPIKGVYINEANHIDIKLPPEGFVRYQLRQVKPFNGSIEVMIGPYESLSVVTFNGQGLNTEYFDRRPGGAEQRILVSIKWNTDSIQLFNDTLLVPRFDTINHLIEF